MNIISTSLYTFKNFRDLTESESDEVLQGRNDPQVRRWMTSDRFISPEEHRCFTASLKTCTTKFYFRVERRGRFAGVYSLTNLRDQSAVGGFWIATHARERLLGLSVVFNSISYVFKNCPVGTIHGYQLANNRPVAKINAMLGFVHSETPLNPDPRMSYLEITRAAWENVFSNDSKMLKMIELVERKYED